MIKSAKSWILWLSVGKAQEQQLVAWKDKEQLQEGAEEGGGGQSGDGTGGGTAQPFGAQLASIVAENEKELKCCKATSVPSASTAIL